MARENIVQILVKARDEAKPDLDALRARLDELGHQVATARAEVDDTQAAATLDRLDAKLMALGKKTANPKIDMTGAVRAEAEIHAVEAALRDLNGKQKDAQLASSGLGRMMQRLSDAASSVTGPLSSLGPALSSFSGGGGIATGVAAGLASGLGGIIPAAVGAGMGLVSFGALAYPTLQKLMTNFTSLQGAINDYGDASANLDTAIHRSAGDWAAYQATIHGIEPDLRSAASLLTNQKVQWQNLTPAMQKNVVALSDNKTALKNLLPDQKTALTALLAQQDAWNNMTPAQHKATRSLQSLKGEFDKLVKAVAPLTFKVFNDGLTIANTLLPVLLPFAQAAGTAIDGLLRSFEKFAKSPGFKHWEDQMLKLSGPMITTLGEGLGKVAIAVGKLLIALANPQALRTFAFLLNTIAVIIEGVAIATQIGTAIMIKVFHGVAVAFDYLRHQMAYDAHNIAREFDTIRHAAATFAHNVAHDFDSLRHTIASWAHDVAHDFDSARHTIATWAHDVAHYFDDVRHTIASWGHDVASTFDMVRHWIAAKFDEMRHDVAHWVDDVINFFRRLPGDIVSALGDLGHLLLNAGHSIISGLISGIESAVPGLHSALSWVSSLIPSWKGPLEADARMLVQNGQVIIGGLIAGMNSRLPDLQAQLARTAATISGGLPQGAAGGFGTAAGGFGTAAGMEVTLRFEGSDSPLVRAFFDQLKGEVRTAGGGGPNSVQRALGQTS